MGEPSTEGLREKKPPKTSFFRDLAEAERNGTRGPDAYAAASEKAGISWL